MKTNHEQTKGNSVTRRKKIKNKGRKRGAKPGRPPDHDAQNFDNKVIACFINSSGEEVTTIEERAEVIRHWESGDYEFHRTLAAQRGLLPISLLVACFLDQDHPLLSGPNGCPMTTMESAIAILREMYKDSFYDPE